MKFTVPLGLASGSEVERTGRDLDLGCDEVALPANALGCTGMSQDSLPSTIRALTYERGKRWGWW